MKWPFCSWDAWFLFLLKSFHKYCKKVLNTLQLKIWKLVLLSGCICDSGSKKIDIGKDVYNWILQSRFFSGLGPCFGTLGGCSIKYFYILSEASPYKIMGRGLTRRDLVLFQAWSPLLRIRLRFAAVQACERYRPYLGVNQNSFVRKFECILCIFKNTVRILFFRTWKTSVLAAFLSWEGSFL